MYSKGDKVVHPMYGAGVIDDIEEKFIDDQTKPYYVLKIPVNDLTVSIGANSPQASKMRQVHEKNKLMSIISNAQIRPINPVETWTEVYKDNLDKVKSGKIEEVASVLKYLSHKERGRSLSTMEKKMMCSARQIVLSEIILSCGVQKSEAETMLRKSLG